MIKKIAIITDVHGNLEALTSVLEDIKKNNFDEIICLGDSIDIGPNSKECIDLLIENNVKSVLGNHEIYLLRGTNFDSSIVGEEKEHYDWVRESLTEKVTYSMTGASATPGYFKIEGKWNYPSTDGTVKDAHVILYKCRVSEPPDFTINDSSGDFGDCSFTAVAVPTNKDGKWWDMVLQAKATEIGAE